MNILTPSHKIEGRVVIKPAQLRLPSPQTGIVTVSSATSHWSTYNTQEKLFSDNIIDESILGVYFSAFQVALILFQ
jgi:hypothetical protein